MKQQLETNNTSSAGKFSRAEIIKTVQTPLGFFTLIVLVVEVLLSALAGFSPGPDRTILIAGMLTLIFALVAVVVTLAIWRPESLQGKRPTLVSAVGVPAISDVVDIKKTKVLCAATSTFEGKGFEKDIAIVQQLFKKPHIAHNITSSDLRKLLTGQSFDIVHLLGFVDTDDGCMVFEPGDKLSSEGFAGLLDVCKTQLVVLASCDSINLAASVSRKVNIIAATRTITIDNFVKWADCFYNLLYKGHPLSRAYDIAKNATDAPMVLLMNHDVKFSS